MKSIASICGLLLAASVSPASAADVCLDFQTCDFLELTITGDLITGTWVNWDCEGNNAGPLWGIIRDGLPLPCGPYPSGAGEELAQNPAKAGITCLWDSGCETSDRFDWYFFLDDLDGSMDLGFDINQFLGPPGTCGIDDFRYELLLGPCPAMPQARIGPQISLQELVRRKLAQE